MNQYGKDKDDNVVTLQEVLENKNENKIIISKNERNSKG